MASFDENGKYIKTNWKAGDKITATKLNKIEESIEAVNDNDISRHVEADARLDVLEAKDVAHDKELTNIKKTIADNKAAAELGDYDINSRMTFLENEFNEGIEALNEGIEEVHNVAETVDGKIATAEANMAAQVNTAKNEMAAQVNTAKEEMTTQVNAAHDDMRTQVNTAQANMTAQVNQGKADMEAMVAEVEADLSSSISEELTNNDVTSFKAGTSNVTSVDLSNQMEQSLVDITYIKGNVIDRDGKFNPVVVNFDSGEKELHSLQDRFYDEYKDGKLYKRIKKLTNKDFNINNIERGSNAGWNESGNTYGFYIRKIGDDCIDITSIDCNLFRYNEGLVDNDIPGVSISAEYSWIGFRVNKTTLGITSGDTDSAKLEKAKEWFKRTYIEVYYLVNETITDESITTLANPNEELNVVSGTPTTIKHAIQLNTKSQIEETQKQIIKNNKSIWQKLKTLTDVEFKIGQSGYIKLPTILGGLLIQWGRTNVTFNNEQYKATNVEYPIPFKTDIYFQTCNMFNDCTEAYETNTSIVWDGLLQGKICIYNIRGNMSCDVFVYYVAIGK